MKIKYYNNKKIFLGSLGPHGFPRGLVVQKYWCNGRKIPISREWVVDPGHRNPNADSDIDNDTDTDTDSDTEGVI